MANCSSILRNFCKLDITSMHNFKWHNEFNHFVYETKTITIKISDHFLAQKNYF